MKESNSKRSPNVAINLLKLFTMLLIINSHSDILYPPHVQFLATGGGIGNELFFLISGYLFSAKSNIKHDIWKRFICLYVPVYIMLIVTSIISGIKYTGLISIIRIFVWPTEFWFLGAILLYSIILYALIQIDIGKSSRFLLFGMSVLIIDLILYILMIPDKSIWIVEDAYFGFVPYRSVYSIFAFVLGYYLKANKEHIVGKIKESYTAVIAIALFAGFYGFKFFLNKKIIPMSVQILSHPLTIACALFIFLAFLQLDLNTKIKGKRIEHWINNLAGLSMESYLVQFLIIARVASLEIIFPINFVVCIVAIFVAAWILHWASRKLTRMILRET